MNILEKIVLNKRREIAEIKKKFTIREFENSLFFDAERPPFYESIKKNEPAVIAEFKRKSPSKGVINDRAVVEDVVKAYENAGASAVSILTDIHFSGKPDDIQKVFQSISIPVLRKDFIIDEIQIYEARAWGASAILLIAAILEKEEIKCLSETARKLGLDVLLEVHDKEELTKIPGDVRIVGINNRNLKTFKVDLEQSIRLADLLPREVIKVSESGIDSAETLLFLYRSGFNAFLIGENFMKEKDPGMAAQKFINDIGQKLTDLKQ